MPLKSGDCIERYVIEAVLGRGGMGTVYRARDERLQRSVALKIVRLEGIPAAGVPSAPASTDGAARLLREARAAAALDHPNVVAIFDVGQIESPEELRGTTYLAMELIRGRTLRSYVGDAAVSMRERIDWLAQIAGALAAAHAIGLVHRDVKPDNVMIRDDRRVKVLDFGIARRTARDHVDPMTSTEGLVIPTLTAQGVAVGTPMYMAPEQLRAESLDGRADQFSWGVVAYELLAGRLPWATDAGSITLVSQILSGAPAPLSPETEIPPHVADVVLRALAKDRDARFPSMAAVVEALGREPSPLAQTGPQPPAPSLPSAPPPAVVPPPPERDAAAAASPPPPRRLPRIALGAAAFAAVAALVWLGVRARERAHPVSVAAPDATGAGCASSRACTDQHGGTPYACRASDRACVPIASEDCTPKYDAADLARDDTIWFGAMFPLKGASPDDFGRMNMEGVDFARAEIAQALASLGPASRGVRRVALVACDDTEDPMRAARHLVGDVGVPGIVGFRSAQEAIDVAGGLLIDRGVVAVVSTTSSTLVTRLPQPAGQPRLVWRTTFNYDAIGEATARLVHDAIEPRVRDRRPTRIAFVRTGSAMSLALADSFYAHAVFNGKSAVENGRDYREIVLDADRGMSPDGAAKVLLELQPSVVVFVAFKESALAVVQAVEAGLPAGARRPTYVLPLALTSNLGPFLDRSAEHRHRVFSVVSSSDSMANARFVMRYNQVHTAQVTRTFNPSVSYDAFYLLTYASFALLPGDPVTGVALATRIPRLLGPGRSIDLGPAGIVDGLDLLSRGQSIDLDGVASGLDFDPKTGEAPSDFALECPAVGDDGRALNEDVESGVTYVTRERRTEGTIRCP